VGDLEFVFGTGGIHGSITNQIVESDEDGVIVDLDVSSFYPNLSIVNKFRPEHSEETFCTIYQFLYEQRKGYAKGSTENAMLKLALNGTYGDSNNKYSVFYDPLFTMSITLNGQLLLCLLAEMLLDIDGLQLIQVNTDGITIKVSRWAKDKVEKIRHYWEAVTRLELEEAIYTKMAIRDVNNYLAIKEDGSIKRRGSYEYKKEWHQDASFLVIPKVVEKVLVEGANIRETVESWPDMMDFMGRTKVPRSSKLMFDNEQIQNTTRYYIAKGGGELVKMMPPETKKGKTEWRSFQVQLGWKVCVCNDIKDAILPVDYEYYIEEVEKLTLRLR
jgi:DNA polymerase elongation subunit (family B)